MPRPQIDLSAHKEEISNLFLRDSTIDSICAHFQQRYSINISHRTLKRRLREWGLRRMPEKAADNPAIRQRIATLVRDGLHDKDISASVQREGLSTIGERSVARIRLNSGLRLRTDREAQAAQEEEIEDVLRQEILHGDIEGYGKVLLYTHLRQKGILCSR